MAETTTQVLNSEREIALCEGKIKYNESYEEFPLLLPDQPERLNPEDAIKSVCDSLLLQETARGESEEVPPPTCL